MKNSYFLANFFLYFFSSLFNLTSPSASRVSIPAFLASLNISSEAITHTLAFSSAITSWERIISLSILFFGSFRFTSFMLIIRSIVSSNFLTLSLKPSFLMLERSIAVLKDLLNNLSSTFIFTIHLLFCHQILRFLPFFEFLSGLHLQLLFQ